MRDDIDEHLGSEAIFITAIEFPKDADQRQFYTP